MNEPDPVTGTTELTPSTRSQRIGTDRLALLLTAAPGVGYLMAWVHDYGYQEHFHFVVPIAVIAPQLGEVLTATVVLFGAIAVIYFPAEIYVSRHAGRPLGPIETRLLAVIVATVLIGLAIYGMQGGRWNRGALVTWALLASAAALATVTPDLFLGHPRTLRERLRLRDARPVAPTVVAAAIVDRIGVDLFVVLSIVLLILFGAYAFGSFQAQIQSEFLVADATATSPPEVVLAIYGDTVVMAPLDTSKHEVRHEVEIAKLGTQPLNFRWITVGPLTGG